MTLIVLAVGLKVNGSNDKVRIGNNHVIEIMGYDTMIVIFPGDPNVKLVDVADVPGMSFNLFSLMAAHTQEEKFTTDEESPRNSLLYRRSRFGGYGSSYSGVACGVETDGGYVLFPLLTPNPSEDCCDFPVA